MSEKQSSRKWARLKQQRVTPRCPFISWRTCRFVFWVMSKSLIPPRGPTKTAVGNMSVIVELWSGRLTFSAKTSPMKWNNLLHQLRNHFLRMTPGAKNQIRPLMGAHKYVHVTWKYWNRPRYVLRVFNLNNQTIIMIMFSRRRSIASIRYLGCLWIVCRQTQIWRLCSQQESQCSCRPQLFFSNCLAKGQAKINSLGWNKLVPFSSTLFFLPLGQGPGSSWKR